MPTFHADALARLAAEIFEHAGAPPEIAHCVAAHLVDANLAGHESHGVLRIPQYVEAVDRKAVDPKARMHVVERFAAGAVVDGRRGFGQSVAGDATRLAVDIAGASGAAAVTLRNCGHTGRLGAYAEMAAAAGMLAIVAVNAGGAGQLVAPFGGAARRLSTNPIAIATPSAGAHPIVLDIATSIAPEGKVRAMYQAGKPLPPGWLVNARGEPSTDPADLYADPPGALLPLGGALGHKGFGLAFLVDILAGALTGAGCCREGAAYQGDGLIVIAVDVAHFAPLSEFADRVAALAAHVKNCPTARGFDAIYVPGELEHRTRELRSGTGIPIEPGSWALIEAVCRRYRIDTSAPLNRLTS
jgi:uncharacterized oxidoreductase